MTEARSPAKNAPKAILGLGMQLFGFLANALTLSMESPTIARMCSTLIAFGGVPVLLGCLWMVRDKGYRWPLGLLGLFSFAGAAIVWFLPRRTPDSAAD